MLVFLPRQCILVDFVGGKETMAHACMHNMCICTYIMYAITLIICNYIHSYVSVIPTVATLCIHNCS